MNMIRIFFIVNVENHRQLGVFKDIHDFKKGIGLSNNKALVQKPLMGFNACILEFDIFALKSCAWESC